MSLVKAVFGLLLLMSLTGAFTLTVNLRATSRHASPMPLAVRGNALMDLNGSSTPRYDEQLGLCFGQNFSSMACNVTAVQQNDSSSYGPVYLLNGRTDQEYWYQVGLSYDWPNTDGTYAAGFNFSYEVWNSSGADVFPVGGGGGIDSFNGTVNEGDNVLLNLYFSSGNVTMYAYDWNTNASAQETYTAAGASIFIGSTQTFLGNGVPPYAYFDDGYFTGLMTEWYHASPYYGGEAMVVYDDSNLTLYWGYIWASEFDSLGGSLFFDGQQVSFSNPALLWNFTTNGAAEAASAYQFITGEPTVDVSPGSANLDIGQSQIFAADVLGGLSPYTYQWYLDGTLVSGDTGNAWMFTPMSAGLHTVYVDVMDSVGAQATSDSANVTVNNVTVNVHDVAVFSLSSSKTVIGQGYTLNMSVEAADLGDYTETFNVTVYANTTYVASENITLQNQTSTNLILAWNTTGFTIGNYVISAYAWPVTNETNTANNNCTGGTVVVTIPGDVNGDFVVNMKDIAIIARAFGTTSGSPGWNSNADINGDGVVNMKDVAIAARHFGQRYP